jgi:hypothetical protein
MIIVDGHHRLMSQWLLRARVCPYLESEHLMALVHINSTVGTTATKLFTVPNAITKPVAVQIQNLDSWPCLLVTTLLLLLGAGRGHSVGASTSFQLWLSGGDTVWAISAAGTTAGAVVITYSGI